MRANRPRSEPERGQRTAVVHRAIRVTVAACAGFYPFVYAVDRPATALYALFTPVALGMLSSIPGSGRQRAAVMLRALPVGLVLVALGTALAARTWSAVLGMLVIGFALAFAGVAGPRAAGVAPGLQLFYILACFPPYAPDSLAARLAGLTLGVLLLAACERFLLPDPPAVPYRERLAEAVSIAGRAAAGAADTGAAETAGDSPDGLRARGQAMRFARLPPAERPAGPGRVDRSFAQAGAATRRLLDQLAAFGNDPPSEAEAASAGLLGRVAAVCADTAGALRTGRPPPRSETLEQGIRDFQAVRVEQATGPPHAVPGIDVLRRQAAVLALAESARMLEIAVRVGLEGRRRTRPVPPRELFWYADASTALLWWRRLAGYATPHSVQLQNAVRTAVGLGAARLVAGSLDLTHGFWVLLAVLTLSRTTATGTWSAVRSGLVGTLVGAVAAGALLLVLGQHTDAYAAVLAPGMLAAFALGPLLGIAWAQALFTLVVSAAFAQLVPSSWQLAEVRLVDVVTGSAIGLLCGLLAWPAGARREVRRTMAALLHSAAPLITGTVGALLAGPRGGAPTSSTLPALHRLRLAEAAYWQYQSEAHESAATGADWQAVLITANHILIGSHWLPRFDLPQVAVDAEAAAWARTAADRLARNTVLVAELCAADRLPDRPPGRPPRGRSTPRPPARPPATADSPPLPVLIDLEHWLTSLSAELDRIESSLQP